MIKPNSSEIAVRAALQLLEEFPTGVVSAIPGTNVYALAQATATSNEILEASNKENADLAEAIVDASSTRRLSSGFGHDKLQTSIVSDSVAVILANIDIAKNKVNPICRTLKDSLNNLFSQEYTVNTNGYSINMKDFSSPCDHAAFDDFHAVDLDNAENYMTSSAKFPIVKNPEITSENIYKLVATANAGFDKAVKEYYGDGERLVTAYWEILNRDIRGNIPSASAELGYVLAIWLVARGLKDSIPEGASGYVEDYNAYISGVAIKAAMSINNILLSRTFIKKSKVLINDVTGTVISVNAEVYSDWLEAGGSSEAIIGYVLKSGSSFSNMCYDAILENIKLYEDVYRFSEQDRQAAMVENKLGMFRRLWPVVVRQFLETSEYAENSAELLPKFLEKSSEMRIDTEERLWRFIRSTVCGVLFPDTDAESLLISVDKLSEAHPDITLDQAIDLTIATYVVDWVSKQLKMTV